MSPSAKDLVRRVGFADLELLAQFESHNRAFALRQFPTDGQFTINLHSTH